MTTIYGEHFGLSEAPFSLTPNTAFFIDTAGHSAAYNMLQLALSEGEGFIKIVGEVGTGKTMLCRKLLNQLEAPYVTAYIPNPYLNPSSLYRALAEELGVRIKSRDGINEYQQGISERLIELVGEGKQVVLVIDEAQAMPVKTLEALRLISNLETENRKLIQIVLFGQPELDEILARHSLRQLAQRISFSYRLPALDKMGARDYLSHRVMRAGYQGRQLFDEAAMQRLFAASQGVPRLLNQLAHKALMSAYGKGASTVGKRHVDAAIEDTEGAELPQEPRKGLWLSALLLVLALGLIGIALWLPEGSL